MSSFNVTPLTLYLTVISKVMIIKKASFPFLKC